MDGGDEPADMSFGDALAPSEYEVLKRSTVYRKGLVEDMRLIIYRLAKELEDMRKAHD